MRRVARLSALLLSALGPFVAAQQPSPSPSPSPAPERFLIESVAVSGTKRGSVQRVVTTSSRLEPGNEYTEAEIRDGIQRVKRLPFVLDARPALRRGSARGTYELIIEIEEAAHFQISGDGYYSANSRGPFDTKYSFGTGSLSLGFDRFLGADTQIVGSTSASGGTGRKGLGWSHATLGLRKYDLAGHGSLFQIDANFASFDTDKILGLSSALTLPLSHNQWLTVGLVVSQSEFHQSSTSPASTFRSVNKSASGNVAWAYDRTDDPFATREGLLLVARADYSSSSERNTPEDGEAFVVHRRYWTHRLGVAYYRPLHRQLSFFAVADSSCTDFDRSRCVGGPGVGLRFVQVGRHNRYRAFADLGFLVGGGYSGTKSSFIATTVRASIGARAPWGVGRFTFAWSSR